MSREGNFPIIKWNKQGLIFAPRDHADWVQSHAWIPTADPLGDGYVRVYFAGRNGDNLSQVGAFTIHLDRPFDILETTPDPIVKLGDLGSFDDSAVLPCCLVNFQDRKLLYYVGWMQGKRVPFYASIGLAISEDGGASFRKHSHAPLLERNDIDPLFTAAPFVSVEHGKWRMWYTTNTRWRIEDGAPKPRYHIKYAESDNGIDWRRDGVVAIDFASDSDYAISRPWVVGGEGAYRMWYAYRGAAYRIGYAESSDGVSWTRMDERSGIDVSGNGFDSDMIEYPCVVTHGDRHYMFYNGNEFGRDGIGLAVSE